MEQTPPPEGHIEILSTNAKKSGLALLMATLPAFATLIYINTFFSSHSQTARRELVGKNMLIHRVCDLKAMM